VDIMTFNTKYRHHLLAELAWLIHLIFQFDVDLTLLPMQPHSLSFMIVSLKGILMHRMSLNPNQHFLSTINFLRVITLLNNGMPCSYAIIRFRLLQLLVALLHIDVALRGP
jgi:hypothetical protein